MKQLYGQKTATVSNFMFFRCKMHSTKMHCAVELMRHSRQETCKKLLLVLFFNVCWCIFVANNTTKVGYWQLYEIIYNVVVLHTCAEKFDTFESSISRILAWSQKTIFQILLYNFASNSQFKIFDAIISSLWPWFCWSEFKIYHFWNLLE